MGNSDSRRKLWAARFEAGKCIYCGKKPFTPGKKGCKKCCKKKVVISCRFSKNHPSKQKNYRKKIRFEVLQKYGGVCKCCGESNLLFLTIDHINKDGARERRELYGSSSGQSFPWFLKLKREKIRKDLQVLCYNCNMASFYSDVCPHRMNDEQREKDNPQTVS